MAAKMAALSYISRGSKMISGRGSTLGRNVKGGRGCGIKNIAITNKGMRILSHCLLLLVTLCKTQVQWSRAGAIDHPIITNTPPPKANFASYLIAQC